MRQHETEKWLDPWFRRLSVYYKAGYLYLLDCCDAAGVWEVDRELAEFQIGHDVDWEHLVDVSEGRLKWIDGAKKLWLTKFMHFQSKGGWKPKDGYVVSVRRLVQKHNLRQYGFDEEELLARGLGGGLEAPSGTPKGKGRGKDTCKSRKMTPPEIHEIAEYIAAKGYAVDAEEFHAFYASKGWKVGNQPMKSWRSAVVTWEKRRRRDANGSDGAVDRAQAILEAEGLA